MALIIPKKIKVTQRVLKNVAKPVTFEFPAQLAKLAIDMHEFMNKQDAIGLAAPQIGISRRLFVMNVDGQMLTCFNPEALHATEDQTMTFMEGCLSFPDEYVETNRPRKVLARFQNFMGTWEEHELEGLAAVCYQHELDHLDGITMHERKKS
jgi:peptide deformylase